MFENHDIYVSKWLKYVKTSLDELGLSFLWISQDLLVKEQLDWFKNMLQFIVTFLAILSVTHVSLSEPSEHRTIHLLPNIDFKLSGSITTSSLNRTPFHLEFGLLSNSTSNNLKPAPEPCFGLLCDRNLIKPVRYFITSSSDDPILVQFVGNKAAHVYNGNVLNRKPKFPCTSCNKAVTSRSKAVSCDVCENWTHVQCTNTF